MNKCFLSSALIFSCFTTVIGVVTWSHTLGGDICESLKTGDYVDKLVATGASSTLTYWIDKDASSPNLPFEMCHPDNNEESTNGSVCVASPGLDYESNKRYKVVQCASDGTTSSGECTDSEPYIDDANDNAPQFLFIPYSEDVLEGIGTVGQLIVSPVAQDYDSAYSALLTISLDANDDGLLDVTETKLYPGTEDQVYWANITLAKELDYETSQIHTMTIRATDQGGLYNTCGPKENKTSSTTLYLNVMDGPDTAPRFSQPQYTADVDENSGKDTEVITVNAADGDIGLDWDIQYSIPAGSEVFKIDKDSGNITIKGEVDRESQSVLENNGVYSLTVMAMEVKPPGATFDGFPGAMSSNVTVNIAINDVNDEAPTFYESSAILTNVSDYSAIVMEHSQNAITGLTIFVKDDDQGENAKFNLTLEGGDSSYFSVEPAEAVSEASVTIRITNPDALDYENVKELWFMIKAQETDSTSPHSSTANVTIKLEDINDNFPVFENDEYEFSVPEGTESGTNIGTIKASDADSGEYGNITFTLTPKDTFDIHPNGTVFVVNELDRELRPEYYLTVRAQDGGGLLNTTQLTIVIEDINDKSPKFQQDQYSGNWIENAVADPVIIYATDQDEQGSVNSNITYKFEDDSLLTNYTITTTSDGFGNISPKGTLNAEALVNVTCESNGALKYQFEVLAVDNGEPPLNDSATVTIYLQDANDFEPVFDRDLYTGSVAEKSVATTKIANVSATDGDACSPNNDIIYSVHSDFADKFSMEQTAGEDYGTLVVRSTQLDRDDIDTYNVTVLALDNGQPRMTGTTTVIVTITDINDKSPVFNDSSPTTAEILENSNMGFEVARVSASDPDENYNLTFTIIGTKCENENQEVVDDAECEDWFAINTTGDEGVILVNSELDRETVQKVTLTIQVEDMNAEDKETNQQTDTMTMEITVNDYNDNAPVFDKESYVFTVDEESNNGTLINQISASDRDVGNNSEIEFSVNSDYVTITPGGQLQVSGRIDREGDPGNNFTAVVFATDKGDVPLTTNITFIFNVADINDNDPTFGNQISFTCSVKEGSANNAEVCTINATDKDIGDFGTILYSLNPDSDFSVNEETGTIQAKRTFDREDTAQYQLKLRAVDDNGGEFSRNDEVDLTIYIEDIDDNDPQFGQTEQELTIAENSREGSEVGYILKASDDDTEEYSKNSYFLIYKNNSQDEEGLFILGKSNRSLTTNTELDRELNTSYILYVLTTKNNTISSQVYEDYDYTENSILTVTVLISDENDNNPQFSKEQYTADIQKGTQTSDASVITTVQASDPDYGPNSTLTYSITSQTVYLSAQDTTGATSDIFTIQTIQGKGNIYLTQPLTEDVGARFELKILVTDGGNLTDESTLTIKVYDSDETVVLESWLSVDELNENREELETDLEGILDADVIIDAILPHGTQTQPQARAATDSTTTTPTSDIKFHSTQENSTQLIPADDVINELDSSENTEFMIKWSIKSITPEEPEPVDSVTENDILKAILVVVVCLLIVILVVYTTAFICMRRSYRRKMEVARATEDAAKDMMKISGNSGGALNVPNTNQNASGEQQLYVVAQTENIDLGQIWATNDDDSIDDNAVDSQDSAISADGNEPVELYMDMDNDFDNVDIDFNTNDDDAQKLAAALSNRQGGAGDIMLMFDNPAMEDLTAM